MPTWLIAVLGSTGVTGLYALVRHAMNLRLYRHTYDQGGAEDMLAASQAVNARSPAALARARAVLSRRRAGRPSSEDDPGGPTPPTSPTTGSPRP